MSDGVKFTSEDAEALGAAFNGDEHYLCGKREDAIRARADAAERDLAKAREEVAELRRQLTFQRDNNHERNVELDALHYVWCDGGCKGGTHRFTPGEVTEETVAAAERNTKRLRSWWNNHKSREARLTPPPPSTPIAGEAPCPGKGLPFNFAGAHIKGAYETVACTGACRGTQGDTP